MASKDKHRLPFIAVFFNDWWNGHRSTYKDSHIFFDFGTEFLISELELPDESVQTLTDHKVIPHLKICNTHVSLTNTKGMKIKTMH